MLLQIASNNICNNRYKALCPSCNLINLSTQYLDILIDPSFPRVNRLFVLLFENEEDRIAARATIFSIIEEANKAVLDFSQ